MLLHMGLIGRVFSALLLLFIGTHPLLAESLTERLSGVPSQYVSELRAEQAVHRNLGSWENVALVPDHSLTERVQRNLEEAKPNVLSERLTLIDRGVTDAEFLELYNSLRRVSEWADIEYYNPQKDRWNPLFGRSYRVGSESSDKALPDPVVRRIPREDDFLVLQDLEPFGETISRYRYLSRQSAFLFIGRNLTRITHRGFPVVGPQEMVTLFFVLREQDYTLVYGVGGANVFNVFGLLSGMINDPFKNRTTGLLDWYTQNYLTPLREGELVSQDAHLEPGS